MFDFTKIAGLIPEGGSLSMVFRKTGQEMTVLYAPKWKNNGDNKGLAPLPLKGTIEDFNANFATMITDINSEQKKLAALLSVNVAAKKATIAKESQKKQDEIVKKNGNENAANETKNNGNVTEQSQKATTAPMMDLFSAPAPSAQKQEAVKPVETEEEEVSL